ncbi:MAG: DNA polymerase III subunit gamma/tau [Chloroflexota bacterium]
MAQVLYLKWRPQDWDQVVGQDHIIQTIHNAVVAQRVAHAYLFAGPRGTGKTTTARLLGKAVNCLDNDLERRPCNQCDHCKAINQGRFLDLIEIDAASNTSVDDVRDLREKINFSPNQGRYKVYIIDEVHMLSKAAFNALLKTLEEPPPHAIFVLATTEVHKIPPTVLSRCQRHEFRRLPTAEIRRQLRLIVEAEGIRIDENALSLIARQATGSLRDAISLLDQLASTGSEICLEYAEAVLGTATEQSVLDVVDALLAKDAGKGLDHLHRTLDAGADAQQFARQIVNYMRNLLLVKMGNASLVEATREERSHMAEHARRFETDGLLGVIRAFSSAANPVRSVWQPALALEIAFMEALVEPSGIPAWSESQQGGTDPQQVPQKRTLKETPQSLESVDEKPSSEGNLTMGQIRSHWSEIRKLLRENSPQTEGLLNSCRSVNLKGGTLELGFASNVLKSKMEKEGNVEKMQWALEQVFGFTVLIRCALTTGEQFHHDLPEGVPEDGMIRTALDLGGKIVDIQ